MFPTSYFPGGYFEASYFDRSSLAPPTPSPPVAQQSVLFPPDLFPARLFPSRLFPATSRAVALAQQSVLFPPALFPARLFPRRLFPYTTFTPGANRVDLRQALTAYLLADPTLSSIVGARIRPGGFSEADAGPSIGYYVLKNNRGHILRGAAGFAVAHVQLDCWSRNLADCVASKIAIEAILDGKVPVMPGFPVRYTKQLDEQDLHEAPGDGSDRWLYHIALIYFVKYDASRPTFP